MRPLRHEVPDLRPRSYDEVLQNLAHRRSKRGREVVSLSVAPRSKSKKMVYLTPQLSQSTVEGGAAPPSAASTGVGSLIEPAHPKRRAARRSTRKAVTGVPRAKRMEDAITLSTNRRIEDYFDPVRGMISSADAVMDLEGNVAAASNDASLHMDVRSGSNKRIDLGSEDEAEMISFADFGSFTLSEEAHAFPVDMYGPMSLACEDSGSEMVLDECDSVCDLGYMRTVGAFANASVRAVEDHVMEDVRNGVLIMGEKTDGMAMMGIGHIADGLLIMDSTGAWMKDSRNGDLMEDVADDDLLEGITDGNLMMDMGNGSLMMDMGNGNLMKNMGNGNLMMDIRNGNLMMDMGNGNLMMDMGNGNLMKNMGNGNLMKEINDGNLMMGIGDGNLITATGNCTLMMDADDGTVLVETNAGTLLLGTSAGAILDADGGSMVLVGNGGRGIADFVVDDDCVRVSDVAAVRNVDLNEFIENTEKCAREVARVGIG